MECGRGRTSATLWCGWGRNASPRSCVQSGVVFPASAALGPLPPQGYGCLGSLPDGRMVLSRPRSLFSFIPLCAASAAPGRGHVQHEAAGPLGGTPAPSPRPGACSGSGVPPGPPFTSFLCTFKQLHAPVLLAGRCGTVPSQGAVRGRLGCGWCPGPRRGGFLSMIWWCIFSATPGPVLAGAGGALRSLPPPRCHIPAPARAGPGGCDEEKPPQCPAMPPGSSTPAWPLFCMINYRGG